MGKSLSKRSVDITTDPSKKSVENADELPSGKVEKLDESSTAAAAATTENGDAAQENGDGEKPDISENDKDATTEKSAETAAVASSASDASTPNAAEAAPVAAAETDEANSTIDANTTVDDAERSKLKKKKKWSLKSTFSFGKKDKQKPAKSTGAAAATTNGGVENPDEATKEEPELATPKTETAATPSTNANGDSQEEAPAKVNGNQTPDSQTPTEVQEPAAKEAVTTNETEAVIANATESSTQATSNESNSEPAVQQTEPAPAEVTPAPAPAAPVAVVSESAAISIVNGDAGEKTPASASDLNEIANPVEAAVPNDLSAEKQEPHQNGLNGDAVPEEEETVQAADANILQSKAQNETEPHETEEPLIKAIVAEQIEQTVAFIPTESVPVPIVDDESEKENNRTNTVDSQSGAASVQSTDAEIPPREYQNLESIAIVTTNEPSLQKCSVEDQPDLVEEAKQHKEEELNTEEVTSLPLIKESQCEAVATITDTAMNGNNNESASEEKPPKTKNGEIAIILPKSEGISAPEATDSGCLPPLIEQLKGGKEIDVCENSSSKIADHLKTTTGSTEVLPGEHDTESQPQSESIEIKMAESDVVNPEAEAEQIKTTQQVQLEENHTNTAGEFKSEPSEVFSNDSLETKPSEHLAHRIDEEKPVAKSESQESVAQDCQTFQKSEDRQESNKSDTEIPSAITISSDSTVEVHEECNGEEQNQTQANPELEHLAVQVSELIAQPSVETEGTLEKPDEPKISIEVLKQESVIEQSTEKLSEPALRESEKHDDDDLKSQGEIDVKAVDQEEVTEKAVHAVLDDLIENLENSEKSDQQQQEHSNHKGEERRKAAASGVPSVQGITNAKEQLLAGINATDNDNGEINDTTTTTTTQELAVSSD